MEAEARKAYRDIAELLLDKLLHHVDENCKVVKRPVESAIIECKIEEAAEDVKKLGIVWEMKT